LKHLYLRVTPAAWLAIAFFLSLVALPGGLQAGTISGTIKDPSGAVVAGARIEIAGENLIQPVQITSDATGKFTSPELKAGKYVVRVSHEGFELLERAVDLQDSVQLEMALAIPRQEAQVEVQAKGLANSDPVYKELRGIGLGETFRLDNFTLNTDVGTFHFDKGTLTWLRPVENVVTGAVFAGEGHFHLKAVTQLDANEIKRRTGNEEVDEDFTEVIFRFTRGERTKFQAAVGTAVEPSREAASAFEHWKDRMRHRREYPLGFTDSVLDGETMDNIDADVLAAVYNPQHPAFLNAYVRGTKHKDLRFFVRTRVGALPQFDSPEEVALINFDPEGSTDGVWYLAHLKSEYINGKASSQEDRRIFATSGYKIETVIAKNQHLFSTATIKFKPLIAGERVLKFGLLPTLRVTRVVDGDGENLHFIQESRKEDGSFYVVLSNAPPLGQDSSITVEYAGDKVLEQAGEGSFYVEARTSWYPNLNGFGEHSLYDLTFKVPRRYKVVSVGALKDESVSQDLAITHWVTPIPVAVAGFNYGDYKKLELNDDITHYRLSGYYLSELPSNLRNHPALQSMSPGAMTKYALTQARAQLQICTMYFGKSPYEDVYLTEQPNFNFGQSWPNLVYLPISAYTDSTQRWMLFGNINSQFTGFVQEVTPHEVAHQWWGHTVGWASYHDQWLSEGFAEFSAGLFIQNAFGPGWHKDWIEFWDRLRERVLDKNNFGVAPNDAGPLWMGMRLISPHTLNAYQNVTYPKGAYVLEMLRSIMYSPEDKDKEFIAMMHDFVDSYRDRPACTESFKTIAEKYMTKTMDLRGDHKLNWFFDEWVYGTQVPKYHFEYEVTPADGGKAKLHMTITQSEVDDHFMMLVPVYADFGKGWVRIGQIGAVGSGTRSTDAILPAAPKKVALNAYKEILER
jgi:Peptidase family M1 domain/Carboxypeptidase regulatory-like domain